jgi:hypothetical protein
MFKISSIGIDGVHGYDMTVSFRCKQLQFYSQVILGGSGSTIQYTTVKINTKEISVDLTTISGEIL